MASREGQGMQIAVILFALITVVLAITTYIFYAEANKLSGELAQEKDRATKNEKGQQLANYKLTAIMYTMGMKDWRDVEAAKTQAGVAQDDDVEKWLKQYRADMQIVGDDPAAPKDNYISMVNKLLTTLTSKNNSLSEANNTTQMVQQQKDQELKDMAAAKKKAEDDLQAAITGYNTARQQLSDQLAQATKEKEELNTQFEEAKKALDATVTDLNGKIVQLDKDNKALKASFSLARSELEQLRGDQGANFDNPDGLVNWVNQRQRLAWINLGSADGLTRQMTFSVFGQQQANAMKMVEQPKLDGSGQERVAKLDAKGRIEVVRVTGPHEAECRILEDHASDPILPGDWIQTPAWSPGQHYGFALAGRLDVDLNGDGDADINADQIKNLIRVNGGAIDAELMEDGTIDGEITVRTRYMVEGEVLAEGDGADAKNLQAGLKTMEEQRIVNGVEKISVRELLERMGWKPEERTRGLGGRSDVGAGQFRRRTPGGKADEPAPVDSTPAPMPMSPSTEPADPFGSN